jgi:hypothetical protein
MSNLFSKNKELLMKESKMHKFYREKQYKCKEMSQIEYQPNNSLEDKKTKQLKN